MLRSGGNAVDAAVAAAAVQSVVELPWGGIGGDAFLLVSTPSGEVAALNGSGAAPASLDSGVVPGRQIPRFGPLSVGVPGCAAALRAAAERFGTRPLASLLEPAVGYAREGFAVSPELNRAIGRLRPQLPPDSALAALLEQNDCEVGETFCLPRLAETLEAVGEGGFYRGWVAEALADFVQDNGGLLAASDMADHAAAWTEPLSIDYRDVRVYTQPPVSLGCVLLMLLGMYERLALDVLAPNEARRIDAMVRCKHAAFTDVLGRLSDDSVARRSAEGLLSDEYLAQRCERLLSGPPAGLDAPSPAGSDTTCVAVLDGAGGAATLIHSLFNEFGSRVYEPRTGVLLNDRLANQVVGTGPNEIVGGRKPLHTLNSFLVLRDGLPIMAGATPGGRGQVQVNFQVIVNVVDTGMGLQDAVDAPRWLSGAPRRPEPNQNLYIEQGIDDAAADALRLLGHEITTTTPEDSDLFGSVVLVGKEKSGRLLGAADHRREATTAAV